MAKVVACIIARTVSKRLPLKILRDLAPGISMIELLIRRVKAVQSIDQVYICTSREPVDDILEDIAFRNGVSIYRGSPDEVIERMLAVGDLEQADILLRITGDNPFTAVEFIPVQLSLLTREKLDYVRVVDVPIGATAELMTLDALKRCNALMDPTISEYLMLYIFEPQNFKCGVVKPFMEDFSGYSLTVDTYKDFERSRGLLKALNWNPDEPLMLTDVMSVYQNGAIPLVAKNISEGGDVKLPYGKVIPFIEFKTDMDRRVKDSKMVKLYE